MCTNGHTLAQLELSDGLASQGHDRLLTGDLSEVADGALNHLGVTRCFTNTGVHDNLHEAWDLVGVRVAESFREGRNDVRAVDSLEARNGRCLCLGS